MSVPSSFQPANLKPFVCWMGGKQKYLSRLLDRLPSNEMITRYYEPFLGGGSLFFSQGYSGANLSDINPQLMNSYKWIRDDYAEVGKKIMEFQAKLKDRGSSHYYSERKQFNQKKREMSLSQAARFICLIHASYNGMFRVNKKEEFNTSFGGANFKMPERVRLKELSLVLKGTNLGTCSYSEALGGVQSGDLIYLDPPYPKLSQTASFNGYHSKGFGPRDHARLAHLAQRLSNRGALIMISYADTLGVRSLFPESKWNVKSFEVKRTISKRFQTLSTREVIITNY